MFNRNQKSLVSLATRLVGILGMIVLSSLMVFAHSCTATISGAVRDATGGVLPGVSITAKHIESRLTREVITNETGNYRMPSLPVGAYEVTAELSGFKQQVRRGITLAVAQEAVVNLTL